jgi:shikimate kinase
VVIALGGGAITQPENRRLIAQTGISIWLDAPFELCWQRIQSDHTVRPLAPNEEEARARYLQRLPLYQPSALHIEVRESQSPDELAAIIVQQLDLEKRLIVRPDEER